MAEAPLEPITTFSKSPEDALDLADEKQALVHGGDSIFKSYSSKIAIITR